MIWLWLGVLVALAAAAGWWLGVLVALAAAAGWRGRGSLPDRVPEACMVGGSAVMAMIAVWRHEYLWALAAAGMLAVSATVRGVAGCRCGRLHADERGENDRGRESCDSGEREDDGGDSDTGTYRDYQ